MIKRRVIQLIDSKGVGKEKFFTSLGVTSANFRGGALDSSLSSNIIEKIIAEIPDVNIEWLLTGKGEMIKTENCRSPEGSNSLFEKLLESKEETIKAKNSQIKLLEEQVEDLKGELLTFESARSSVPTQASEESGGIPKQTTRGRA